MHKRTNEDQGFFFVLQKERERERESRMHDFTKTKELGNAGNIRKETKSFLYINECVRLMLIFLHVCRWWRILQTGFLAQIMFLSSRRQSASSIS